VKRQRRFSTGSFLASILTIAGSVALCLYGWMAAISEDLLWFRGGASVPDPNRVVIWFDGQETVLTPGSPGYEVIVSAVRAALSRFENLAPLGAGLNEASLTEYQHTGTLLELTFDTPPDFHLPFSDGRPTGLLFPIEGKLGGKGYVFRGRDGRWWSGQLVMSDPQPLYDALSALGYTE
jgi:hypothetical protein